MPIARPVSSVATKAAQLPPSPLWLPLAPWVFIVVWSAGYSVAQVALEYTTPLMLLALRFCGAVICITPFLLVLRPAFPSRQDTITILTVAFFVQLVHFGCVYIGLELGASAGIMALFAASQPVLVHIASSFIHRRIPRGRIWLGLGLGLAGAAWVLGIKGFGNADVVLGVVLGFLAVVGLSVGVSIENWKKPHCHRLMNFWLQYLFVSAISLPMALVVSPSVLSTQWQFVAATGYLILGNSLFGIYLLLTLFRYGQIQRMSSIMMLVPPIAALIAWILVGEILPLAAWPGIGLAIIGVLLVLYAPASQIPSHTPASNPSQTTKG